VALRTSPETGASLERGWAAIYAAIDLWSLVDPARAQALRAQLKTRWETEDGQGDRVIAREDLPGLAVELEALPVALRPLLHADATVPHALQAAVRGLRPLDLVAWTEDGREHLSLSVTLLRIAETAAFLRRAHADGLGVLLD
jgi:hypothetical protein